MLSDWAKLFITVLDGNTHKNSKNDTVISHLANHCVKFQKYSSSHTIITLERRFKDKNHATSSLVESILTPEESTATPAVYANISMLICAQWQLADVCRYTYVHNFSILTFAN